MHIDATIHVHVVDDKALQPVQDRLDLLVATVNRVLTQGERVMTAADDLKAGIAQINEATNNIASDIQRLKDKISSSMSAADVADVQGELTGAVSRLQGLAADPDNPDPAATPTPVPEPEPEPEAPRPAA